MDEMWWAPGEISQVREKLCPDLAKYVAFMTYIHSPVENILTPCCYFFENKNISAFAVSVFIFGELHQKKTLSPRLLSLQHLPLPMVRDLEIQ